MNLFGPEVLCSWGGSSEGSHFLRSSVRSLPSLLSWETTFRNLQTSSVDRERRWHGETMSYHASLGSFTTCRPFVFTYVHPASGPGSSYSDLITLLSQPSSLSVMDVSSSTRGFLRVRAKLWSSYGLSEGAWIIPLAVVCQWTQSGGEQKELWFPHNLGRLMISLLPSLSLINGVWLTGR